MDVVTKMCEDCSLKTSTFGLPAGGKARWCAGCAKAHAGATDWQRKNKMCEDCGKTGRSHGLPLEAGVRSERVGFEVAKVASPLVWESDSTLSLRISSAGRVWTVLEY